MPCRAFTYLIVAMILALHANLLCLAKEVSYFDLANRQFVHQEYSKAIEYYDQCLNDPGCISHADDAYFLMARSYILLDDWEKAKTILSQFTDRYPGSELADDALILLSEKLLNQGSRADCSQALEYLDLIIDKYNRGDRLPEALVMKGECQFVIGDWQGAEASFLEVLKTATENRLLHKAKYNLAQVYQNEKSSRRNIPQAIEIYQQLLQEQTCKSDEPKIYFALGSAYRELRLWDNALQYFDKIIKEYPDTFYAVISKPIAQVCKEKFIEHQENLEVFKKMLGQAKIKQNTPSPDAINLLEQLKEKAQTKLNISADSINYDKEKNIAIYQGNVRIYRDEIVITAGKAEVNMHGKTITSQEAVEVTHKGKIILRGDKLNYLVEEGKMVLSGNASLIQLNPRREEQKAGSITYFLATGDYKLN